MGDSLRRRVRRPRWPIEFGWAGLSPAAEAGFVRRRLEVTVPSRRVLNAVAYGVTDSFMSRNNDVGGYWAIGQVLSHALATRNPCYTIDLMSRTSEPPLTGSPLTVVPNRASELFWTNIERQKVPPTVVRRATLTLECDFTRRRNSPLRAELLEHPVRCRVEIQDDRGKSYGRATEVWCFPHDPALEVKSARRA
jgi:hypothetical protein